MLGDRPLDWHNPFTVPFGARPPHPAIAIDAKPKREVVLPAIMVTEKTISEYRKAIEELIKLMADDVVGLVQRTYRTHEPIIAQDAKKLPADKFQQELEALTAKWTKTFHVHGKDLAEWLAKKIGAQGDVKLANAIKRGSLKTIRFKMTKQQRDVMQAIVNENVGLIKSIPQEYLGKVQGAVMRSIARGGDQEQLVASIQKIYKVTKKRAELISRDQSRKASNALQRSRQLELGVTHAIWMHSSASKTPRPSHVAMNGKKYKIKEGMWDPQAKEWIIPGQLINCRCSSRPVLPGL